MTDTVDQAGEVFQSLVGPGKKFDTAEALAKGKSEADAFIEQLKHEKQELLNALNKVESLSEKNATVAEVLEELRKQSSGSEGNQSLTDEELSKKIEEMMKGREVSQTREANRMQGNKLLLEKVGGDTEAAKKYLEDRAMKLGLAPEQLVALSESSPVAFAQLIDVDKSVSPKGTTGLPSSNPLYTQGVPTMEVDGHKTKA